MVYAGVDQAPELLIPGKAELPILPGSLLRLRDLLNESWWRGMLGIHSQAHVDLDGLVEFGEFDFLNEGNSLFERIRLSLTFQSNAAQLAACAARRRRSSSSSAPSCWTSSRCCRAAFNTMSRRDFSHLLPNHYCGTGLKKPEIQGPRQPRNGVCVVSGYAYCGTL